MPPAKAVFLADQAQDQEGLRVASTLFAAESGNIEELKLQLEVGMNPNVRDGYGRTPLHLAAWMGHVEVVEKLLEHPKCMVNALDAHERTPLGLAMLEQRYSSQSVKDNKQKVAGLLRKSGGKRAALYKKEYPSGPANSIFLQDVFS